MLIQPKIRGFICTTAHPEGCKKNVQNQIEYVKGKPSFPRAKRVLVIGCSTGYGLASRITCAFGGHAATVGVMFEHPALGKRTATAGWYNTAAFEEFAAEENLYAKTINGDAFSDDIKQQTIDLIRNDLGSVDLVVYSLAAPRRTLKNGETVSSVLKTTGSEYTNQTIDLKTRTISSVTIPPASDEEIKATVAVMGGEDWNDWISALHEGGVLAPCATTVAYSYIGPAITHPIYADGSIGKAKEHLRKTAEEMTGKYGGVSAYVSVNKALVTQSSAAIPIVPLYISILYRVMKEQGVHEGCIQQMYRLFAERLTDHPQTDENGLLRLDDWEMKLEVQEQVQETWKQIQDGNLESLADIDGYWEDFYHMFGFHLDGVDYDKEVDPNRPIPSIAS